MGKNQTKSWTDAAAKFLVGKTIKSVRYMSASDVKVFGWYSSALVIEFTDGSCIFPSADDEGNDAGALFTSSEDIPTIPVMQGGT